MRVSSAARLAMVACAVIACARAEEDLEAVEGEGEEEMGSLGDFIDELLPEVLQAAHKNSTGAPETFLENAQAFYHAVDWGERWIQALLAWHGVCWLVFAVFRRDYAVQCGLFFGICGCVGLAERLNTLGRTHWERFSTQNYFDERGVFAGTIFCAPLLSLSFCMLINFLCLASTLLVDVKRREYRDHLAAKKKEKDAAGDAAAAEGAASASASAKKKKKKPLKAD